MPRSRRQPFAFLIHPRAEVRTDLARRWPSLGRIPEAVLGQGLRSLPLPPLHWGTVHIDDRSVGHLMLVPMSGAQMLADRAGAAKQVKRAVDRSVEIGAGLVGLGALTSPVTRGGELLRTRTDVALTTGNALTAAMTVAEVRRAISGSGPTPTVAVVGANGSVGACVVGLLAEEHLVDQLLLVGRRAAAVEAVAATVRRGASLVDVRSGTDMHMVADADIVVLLTAATGSILRPEHLKPGAVVIDGTQPRNTSPALIHERPDVRVVDGGLVSVPGLHLSTDIDLPPGCVYACLAETMLLALDGHQGHFSVGTATPAQARHVAALAERYGFAPAPPHAFGVPIPAEQGVRGAAAPAGVMV